MTKRNFQNLNNLIVSEPVSSAPSWRTVLTIGVVVFVVWLMTRPSQAPALTAQPQKAHFVQTSNGMPPLPVEVDSPIPYALRSLQKVSPVPLPKLPPVPVPANPLDKFLRAPKPVPPKPEPQWLKKVPLPTKALIKAAAIRRGANVETMYAIAYRETGFNHKCVKHRRCSRGVILGKDGEIGMMQIMPSTASDYRWNCGNIRRLPENIDCAAQIVSFLERQYKDNHRLVAAAYNAGEGNARRAAYRPYATFILKRLVELGVVKNG